ncbi:MAG TPA: hypothetical protein VJ643_04300 [Nitrososphaera sp.]|nr:hypothetical protein [Nitrososphaera sp.]
MMQFWIGRPIRIQLMVLGTDEEDDIILSNSPSNTFWLFVVGGGRLEIQTPKDILCVMVSVLTRDVR